MSRVREKYRVTFDSATDNCFHMHKDDGKILRFQEGSGRLYYFYTVNRDEESTMLITKVNNTKNKLSVPDFTQAKITQSLQRIIWRTDICDCICYVNINMIPTCPITVQDIKNTEFI